MQLPSGRKIALFFYDGPISQDLAFGGLLMNGERFANRLLQTFSSETDVPELVHIATDGETYGHHHRHGDMALAYCLHHIESNDLARITVYGEFLDIAPPVHEVEIIDNTSWSCSHGIERWRSNCGCSSGRVGWNQEWRAPLRTMLDWLREELDPFYGEEMSAFRQDPWKLRNDYIDLILERTPENVNRFFSSNGTAGIGQSERTRMLKLLEMQRHLMLMYTSCGWFFDEISGIETVQVLLYAARAIQLARELGFSDLESRFIDRLGEIRSNIPHLKTGRRVYELYVRPSVVDFLRVAAHYAVSSLFTDYSETPRIFSWEVFTKDYERLEAGKQKVAFGRARMRSLITFEEQTFTFAFLHMGDHNLNGGVKHTVPGEPYAEMTEELREAFGKLNIADIILLIDKHFGTHSYTLWHLFKEESRRIYRIIMESSLRDIEHAYRQIYENHYPIMLSMVDTNTPLPNALRGPVEFVLNNDFRDTLTDDGRVDLARLEHLSEEVIKFSVHLDTRMLGFHASGRVTRQMEELLENPEDLQMLKEICDMLETLLELSIRPNLWKAQNMLFTLSETAYDPIRERADTGDPEASEWIERFDDLEQLMNTRIA